ncbi:MAG TPA: hypothetical protein VEQ59_12355, partial [Polyangiaceae bacterium]|nr:hypothetical protein [Polyangiaceae bacterium]
MRSEADLGKWLRALSVGRASCVFAEDVADTLSVLRDAAADAAEPLRAVSLTWPEVPALANELGLLVSALAAAVPSFTPELYGRKQEQTLTKWTHSAIESEARAIVQSLPDVQGTCCRKILAAAAKLEAPALAKLAHAEQARQLALAIEPQRLLVLIAVLSAPDAREPLKSLAQGAEWLAGNARCRVALVLPKQLFGRDELDHVTYEACSLVEEAAPRSHRAESTKPSATGGMGPHGRVPHIELSPIEGRPANSEAERLLYELITADPKLRPLFGYNLRVETVGGSTP